MKAAFLTSSLISSKGSAAPATRTSPPKELLAREHLSAPIPQRPAHVARPERMTMPTQPVAQAPKPVAAKKKAVKPTASSVAPVIEGMRKETADMKQDSLGRVRMSLRIKPEEHLTLKLLAAYANKSAQCILEEALKEYVQNHGNEILPKECNCVRNRVF